MTLYAKTELPRTFDVSSVTSVFRSKDDLSEQENIIEALPFQEFIYVESGSINILVDSEIFSLTPGSLIFYPPDSFRSIVASRDAVLDVVCFESSSPLLSELFLRIIKISKQQFQKLCEIIELGENLLVPAPNEKFRGGMILKRENSSLELEKLRLLIEFFLLNLYETSPKTSPDIPDCVDSVFLTLMEYLKCHISESITLSDMCKVCNTSASGLHRLCKKQCGTSPTALFISLKIGNAKKLIAETNLSFSEISDALGFSSIHYFSKLFKSRTGTTPSEYAKKLKRTQ